MHTRSAFAHTTAQLLSDLHSCSLFTAPANWKMILNLESRTHINLIHRQQKSLHKMQAGAVLTQHAVLATESELGG